MTKEDIEEIIKDWKEPFKSLLNYSKFSIDYELNQGKSDHKWLEKRGYELHMGSDCAYYIKGVSSLSATSYGDWGTCYVDSTINEGFKLFLEMYKDGIVKLWRIEIYLNKQCYHYNDQYGIWTTYDDVKKEWIECKNPLEND